MLDELCNLQILNPKLKFYLKMKTFTLILLATLLGLSFSSYAQKTTESVKSYSPASAPLKGYYSIGNNAAKLNSPTSGQIASGLEISKSKTVPKVQKGYYATGNNKAKLTGQISFEEVKSSGQTNYKAKPAKGYYSIGRNADKLK
jgi:hypothetical protein